MRTFVAICTPPTGAVPAFLDDCRRRLDTGHPDVKWVAAHHRHVTLRFLGDVAEGAVEGVRSAILEAARSSEPFLAALTGWGAFPNVSRPQTLWVGVDAPGNGFQVLEATLSARLKVIGIVPEAKPFHPHITLGRGRSPYGMEALVKSLKGASPSPAGTEFPVERITLFESVLSPAGPKYTVLLEAPLGADRTID